MLSLRHNENGQSLPTVVYSYRLSVLTVIWLYCIPVVKKLSRDGTTIPLQADTLCIYGDNPEALRFTRQLREALKAEDINIQAFK